MRSLRAAHGYKQASCGSSSSELRPDFKNEQKNKSEKKARTFDFMAMFEQARQVASERNKKDQNISSSEIFMPDKPSRHLSKKEDQRNLLKATEAQAGKPLPPKFKPLSCKTSEKDVTSHKEAASNEGDSERISPPVPSFIKSGANKEEVDEDADLIGPPVPSSLENKIKNVDNEDDDEDDDESEENMKESIPQSLEITLAHGDKSVSALTLDPSGARLVTGGYDCDIRFWDFSGMDSALKPFRTLRPCESHQIRNLQYSTTGDVILVIAANAQAKVLDRDGFEKLECVKGDQYIADMANTKGHVAMLNSGCWNPKERHEFMTCANDGTVRLWDIGNEYQQRVVIKTKNQQGRKTNATACTYSRDGRYIAAACQDGSIQLWDCNRKFVSTCMLNRTAHMSGSDTSSLCFSYDGKVLASRGSDDTLKLWDIRNFKKPLVSTGNLLNLFPVTDCQFSPNDKMVITGVSEDKKGIGTGKLMFFERETLKTVTHIEIPESSAIRCLWHPKLNQIVVGCGNGDAILYYDVKKSHRGAMLCVVKKERKAKQIEMITAQHIITPYALPMFREGRPISTRKQEEKVRKDPLKTRRPDLPVSGPGQGGRVGAQGATLSQYVVQQLVLKKPDPSDINPREAILRHAKDAEENPYWVSPAYQKTQPKTIFQTQSEQKQDDDNDSDHEPVWKKTKLTEENK